ncbi:hypothetical protein [Streptomyces triticiradicis]|uniref:PH domain-containing protein n=1 Tax=Streptomyces triticiradicis TaxID=2651189 RepID=A0A7J5DC74_9ACTN|nr:hypothetical protein [Streptomyces triticiradicis]KAB1986136.1 hypothetical protein F8144_23790 [Streptomyces triticiradicis]
MAALSIAGVAGAAALSIHSLPEMTVVKVSGLISLLSIMAFVGRIQLVPLVRYDRSVVVIRNVDQTYEIPWQTVRSLNWDVKSGSLSLTLDGDRTVPVKAFSHWPSFGRHKKVIEELERAREQRTDTGRTGEPTVTPAPGVVELILVVPLVVTVVALLVKGVTALLS